MRLLSIPILLLALCSAVAAAEPTKVAEQFLGDFLNQRFAQCTAIMEPSMQAAFSEQAMKTALAQISASGECDPASATTVQKASGYDVVTIPLTCGKAPLNALVSISSTGKVGGLFFRPAERIPATPETSASWKEEIVTLEGEPGLSVPGTLTIPTGTKKCPAILLIGGSGPNDRDETIGPNKPFRDLAHGLADHGIATLRFDKRTLVHYQNSPNPVAITLDDEYTEDALAGVHLLMKDQRIESSAIFVAGHSQGGVALPRVAQREPHIAGLLFLATPMRTVTQAMSEQTAYIFGLDGKITPEEQKQLDELKTITARIDALKPDQANAATPILFGAPPSYWLDFKDYHYQQDTTKLSQPLFFAFGGRDYQVNADEGRAWKKLLDESGKKADWKFYPSLNHLFMDGKEMATPQEYERPGHVDAALINDVSDWINSKLNDEKRKQ